MAHRVSSLSVRNGADFHGFRVRNSRPDHAPRAPPTVGPRTEGQVLQYGGRPAEVQWRLMASSNKEWMPEDRTADILGHDGDLVEKHGSTGIKLDQYKQSVAAIYNSRAPKYDAGASYDNHIRWSSGLVKDLAPRTGERILDIATGTGMAALPLAQAVGPSGSVVAIDIAEDALKQLRKKMDESGTSNITPMLQDAETACFEPMSFDAVICSSALTWMSDIPRALSAWRGWLKPGGRLAFHAYSERSFLTGYALSEVALDMGMQDINPHRLYGTPERCREMVKQCGFPQVDIRIVDESRHQPLESMQAAWDGLLAFTWPRTGMAGNPMARLEAEDVLTARCKYEEWLAERSSADGKVWDEHVIYYVVARK